MDEMHIPDCEAFESALCDYLDGTATPELRAEMALHLSQCPACAAYERDIREAMGLLSEAETPDAPAIMVNKILFQIPAQSTGWRGWLGRVFEPVMQPRIVMGAMMTVLSLAMMTRCAGVPSRSLTASDLDPVRIWGSFDDRMHRTWDRSVKAYESMRVVYEVRTRIHEWRQQQEEQDQAATNAAAKDALQSKQVGHQPAESTKPPAGPAAKNQ
jgi:anti-sigma factor RsiW